MKKTTKRKYSNVRVHYKIWMTAANGECVIGEGKRQTLVLIDTLGSLKAAADELKISYRKLWGDLKKAEESLGFALIEKHRGGRDGGKTQLTNEGRRLIEAFDQLHKKFDRNVNDVIIDFKRTLKNK